MAGLSYPAAILLDMDGTLFDTETLFKELWQSTARKFGLHLTDSLYQRFIGARFDQCKELISELGGPEFNLTLFLQTMDKEEKAIKRHPVPLKPGALELLVWLKESRIPVGLVTSSDKSTVTGHFSHYGGEQQFRVIITGEDVSQPKPHPEPYLKACQKLGMSSSEVIAIEDSNPGASSAIAAGCQTIMIPDVLPPEKNIARQLKVQLNSLEQLPSWLEEDKGRLDK